MSEVSEVLSKSVTAADYSVLHFMLPYFSQGGEAALPPALPEYWSFYRDQVLLATITAESMWASAVSIACTKMASASWEVEGDIRLRVKRAHELFQNIDLQRGWTKFISKHLSSYLCTDNGAFIEIVRASTSLNSQIIGLVHLDPLRCMRTGDPERPVIYRDAQGVMHELERHEVIDIADTPDPRELFYGVGHCAASRAYPHIIKMASIETYIYEKVTGRKIKEVHFVSGINDTQIKNFVAAAEHQADAKGLVAYMGAVMVPVPMDRAPDVATVPLAEFPDGFNRKEEFDIAVLAYADAIGLDVQDLQPISGRPLGTATQAEVLSDKAAGKGLASWKNDFVHSMNLWVLPDMTTMAFIEKDWRDKQSEAAFNQTTEQYVSESVVNMILTPSQGLQALVDANVYPKEFLPEDTTPDTDLADTEKPDTGEAPEETPEVETPEIETPEVKDYVDDVLEATREEAEKLAKKISTEANDES